MARPLYAGILVLALVPLLVVTNLAVWVTRSIVDAPAFTGTVDRALEDPTVVSLLDDRATAVVLEAFERLDPLVRGVAFAALGLAPDAGPVAVEAVVRDRVSAVLQTTAVREARTEAVLGIHGLLVDGRAGPAELIVVDADAVRLDVRPIVRRALDTIDPRLVDLGLGAVAGGATRSTLVATTAVADARTAITTLRTALPTLVVIVVLVALLAVVVARDRVGALGWVGLATAVAGVVGLVAAWLGGEPITRGIEDETLRSIASAVYGPLTEPLAQQSVVLIALGGVLLVNGWVAGALAWTRGRARG